MSLAQSESNRLFTAKSENEADGDSQLLMGRMMATLQDLSSFVVRCYDVVRNTVQQLAALHNTNKYVP